MTRCPNHRHKNATKRGVCDQCYNLVAARVHRGLTTWEQAEREGLVGPQAKRGRPLKELKPV